MTTNLFIEEEPQPIIEELFPPRNKLTKYLEKKTWDILVVGGGIHGATVARIAALNGFKTLLVEKLDFASQTSSRSSKMLHGGIRYLEMLDFKQVYKGLKCREAILKAAPHISCQNAFYLPVKNIFEKFKFKIGLSLYDLFSRANKESRHKFLSKNTKFFATEFFDAKELLGFYKFYDGLIDDVRFVMENLISAKQEGATCLNYCELISYYQQKNGTVTAVLRDKLSNTTYNILTGIIINCAGPWVAYAGRLKPAKFQENIHYSKGSHLILESPKFTEGLLIPLKEKTRYFFVWPHPAGALVGTTDIAVQKPEYNPMPDYNEVLSLIKLLKATLNKNFISKCKIIYAFTGIRTLYSVKNNTKAIATYSRSPQWIASPGMLSLAGGKLTTALLTAKEGLEKAVKLADINKKISFNIERPLPGAGLLDKYKKEFLTIGQSYNTPITSLNNSFAKYGALTRYLEDQKENFVDMHGLFISGLIKLAVKIEQACTVEDIIFRRLNIPYLAIQDINIVKQIGKYAQPYFKKQHSLDVTTQTQEVIEQLNQIKSIINQASKHL